MSERERKTERGRERGWGEKVSGEKIGGEMSE